MLNTDASLDATRGGLGGLIRDDNGMMIQAFSVNVDKAVIHELEMEAIEMGVRMAHELGIKSLWIETDSSIDVSVIIGKMKPPWRKANQIRETWCILNQFDSWRISNIWREANWAADFLSKRDAPCKQPNIIPFTIPQKFLDILNADREGMIYDRF
ncbi:uncharacterized protein LOC143878737 [Tasmannia lanceolata]|uniref:uncharacterized protein LOC143878737 n=1 Tax=Tasmannia lanceolata TaxID=3420 RepID=UPI00406493BE